MPDISWKTGNMVRNGVSWKAKRDGWSGNFCETGICEVLTSMERQGEVGKKEAGLVSFENIEQLGTAVISLNLFLYMM